MEGEGNVESRASRTPRVVMTALPTLTYLTTASPLTKATRNPFSITTTVSPFGAHGSPESDWAFHVETPAFVLERRGRHKPLGSYFEDDALDREGSVDRETESNPQDGSHTQGSERGGKVNATAGSPNLETPTNLIVNPTPSDNDDSDTGESNFTR